MPEPANMCWGAIPFRRRVGYTTSTIPAIGKIAPTYEFFAEHGNETNDPT